MLLVGIIWLVGLGWGIGLALTTLGADDKTLEQALGYWQRVDYSLSFWLNCLGKNLLLLGWFLALGLSLIGCPLIGLSIGGMGFLVGWNGVCLLSQLNLKAWLWFGLFFVPVNLLYQLGWLLGAAAALKTGLCLIRIIFRFSGSTEWRSGFAFWAVGLILAASLMQAFLAPWGLEKIFKLF